MALFGKDNITYVDTLHEWRKQLMNIPGRGDFKLLDRVWVTKTLRESEHSHPGCAYSRTDVVPSVEGIIIGIVADTLYAKEGYTNRSTIDGWVYAGFQSDGKKICFRNSGWKVLCRDGTVVNAHTIKKSHGEFQEVFDHMQEGEGKKKLLEEAQQKYTESLQDMEDHLIKGKALQVNMINKLK